jgi:hypothetical protein
MIKKSIIGMLVLMAAMVFAAQNSSAQSRPSPNGCIELLGVRSAGCTPSTGSAGTQNTGRIGSTGAVNNSGQQQPTGRYTPQQINQIRQAIAYYDNLMRQWIQYRDRQVAPYYNHPTYYQWARNEYARSNQSIVTLNQYKAYYQNLLR